MERDEVYRGRGYAIATIAFGREADLETVSSLASEFVRAFSPRDGLRVRAARGPKREILPARFSRTASIRSSQLARGGSIELSAGDFDEPRPGLPVIWVTSAPPHEDGGDDVALRLGFCTPRPRTEKSELAVAHALSTLVEAAVEVDGCVEALATAQGAPLTLTNDMLPFERATETRDAAWLRDHVRSPGWRVLVPRPRRVKPPAGVSVERVPSGQLVRVDAPTPFAVPSFDALERWLAPLLAKERRSA